MGRCVVERAEVGRGGWVGGRAGERGGFSGERVRAAGRRVVGWSWLLRGAHQRWRGGWVRGGGGRWWEGVKGVEEGRGEGGSGGV